MIDQFGNAEAPFHAQHIAAGAAVGQAAKDALVFGQQVDLTAYGTEWAGGGRFAFGFTIPLTRFFGKSAGGASLYAAAAEGAAGV